MSKINLTQQMKDILTDYTDEVMNEVVKALEEVGKDAADELHSDIGGFKNRTGKYRKSWTVTQEDHRTFSSTIVHAKAPHYRLTHLLEYGHATRNGGRTRAFPHIYVVNEKAQEDAVKKIKEVIEKIR